MHQPVNGCAEVVAVTFTGQGLDNWGLTLRSQYLQNIYKHEWVRRSVTVRAADMSFLPVSLRQKMHCICHQLFSESSIMPAKQCCTFLTCQAGGAGSEMACQKMEKESSAE